MAKLNDVFEGAIVDRIESWAYKSDREWEETSQKRIVFTDGRILHIGACGCCDSPWLEPKRDETDFVVTRYRKWIPATYETPKEEAQRNAEYEAELDRQYKEDRAKGLV